MQDPLENLPEKERKICLKWKIEKYLLMSETFQRMKN